LCAFCVPRECWYLALGFEGGGDDGGGRGKLRVAHGYGHATLLVLLEKATRLSREHAFRSSFSTTKSKKCGMGALALATNKSASAEEKKVAAQVRVLVSMPEQFKGPTFTLGLHMS
jgi:hypothetical protein